MFDTRRRTRGGARSRRPVRWRQNWATRPYQHRRVVEHSSTCSLPALDCVYIMARRRRGARVAPPTFETRLGHLARAILLDRLGLDVAFAPGNRLELSTREQLRLIGMVWRGLSRALAIRQHRVRTRLIAELDGEDPSVGSRRDALAVGIIAIGDHAKTPEVPGTSADRNVHIAAAHAMDIAPLWIELTIATLRLLDGGAKRRGRRTRKSQAAWRRRRRAGLPGFGKE